jgi:hypothetical protein
VLRDLTVPPGESAIEVSVSGDMAPAGAGGGGGFVLIRGLQLVPSSVVSAAHGG